MILRLTLWGTPGEFFDKKIVHQKALIRSRIYSVFYADSKYVIVFLSNLVSAYENKSKICEKW